MHTSRILASAAVGLFGGTVLAQSPGMLRYPDVSATHVCFVYANDLWIAPKGGGTASPLASPPGMESLPRFSPDGKQLAFVGNYDGNRDIYVMDVTPGAIPRRITHHPAGESLCDWSPDGKKLLFFTNGLSVMPRQTRLFTVGSEGGMPEALPMPYAGFGAFSPDGNSVVFNPLSIDTRTWKRYRGGMAPDVWILDLATKKSRQITDWEGTDTLPMWHGGTIYYLSDKGPEHRLNIWGFGVGDGTHTQITAFAQDDVRWPSLGPGGAGEGEIVFQLGSQLRILSLGTRESREVAIVVPGARGTLKPRRVDASKFIQSSDVSPTAKRIALGARGDLWSLPAKEGVVRNLTRTPGVAERSAAWSPDGRLFAYFSDESGDYELWVRASDARKKESDDEKDAKDEGAKDDAAKDEAAKDEEAPPAAPRKLTSMGPGFRDGIVWSPDSKFVTFTDQTNRLWLVEIAGGTVKEIDHDRTWGGVPQHSWSHDSGWVAYTRADEATLISCVWLYRVETGEKTRVTSPMFAHTLPVFSRDGKYLYASAARNVGDPKYSDLDSSFIYADVEQIVAFPLRGKTKSPWATKSDEEEPKKPEKKDDDKKNGGEKKDAEKKDGEKTDDAKKPEEGGEKKSDDAKKDEKKGEKGPKKVEIDLDGLESRAVISPIATGTFRQLDVAHDGKLIYVRAAARGLDQKPAIKIFDPKDDKKEEKTIVDDAGGYSLSADGKKLLVSKDGGFTLYEAESGGGKSQKVSTAGMDLSIDPREEWRQIFKDVWRFYRDYFYEPTMHGCDWKALGDHYAAWIDDCTSRDDVNWVIAELISELNIGHAYVTGPGDVESAPTVSVGMLGCDFVLDRSGATAAYRIGTIYRGGAWDADARGPLAQPGIDVKEGDYLLAVDGVGVDPSRDPWAALLEKAGRAVTLTVSASPVLDSSAREILVTAAGDEVAARYRAWIEKNRRYVFEKSGGKIAYVHVPDTGINGQNNLFRQFFGQRHLPAMIIDERWNGGGQIPHRFIELLNRPATNAWALRYSNETIWPPDAHHGPKAMMINGQSGSGGDAFPTYFRAAKLGKLVGRRTWGGLVGITGVPRLVDLGSVSVPMFAYYKLDGNWGVEGHGVDPDIDVLDDPGAMLDGQDPQLDATIAHLMKELETKAFTMPPRPASPDRKGMGIPERDR